jgi:hypothetical protein
MTVVSAVIGHFDQNNVGDKQVMKNEFRMSK